MCLGYTGRMQQTNDTSSKSRDGGARLRLHVLASGSKGNASLIEDTLTGECIAVDCGISWRAFRERSEECGVDLGKIRSVLVTHEHTDHTKGLGVMTRGLAKLGVSPAVYASDAVAGASGELQAIQNAVDTRSFLAGDTLELGDMRVYAFRTSHDAAESFGFRFECAGDSLGFMTDTGIATGDAREALQGCRILAIEANHDPDMLAKGPYPGYLKARIRGERGHLSNSQAAELLETLLDDRLEHVVGMHISQQNNTYELPGESLTRALVLQDHPAQSLVAYQNHAVTVY